MHPKVRYNYGEYELHFGEEDAENYLNAACESELQLRLEPKA